MDSVEFVDPYLDPETGLLQNKLGARTKVALAQAEGDFSFGRLMQLMDCPPRPTGDLTELRAIHRQLFQDIYDWAGMLRIVDIRKNVKGAEFFVPVAMIERAAVFSADELRADNNLKALSRDRFIERLSYHYDQFNYGGPGSTNDEACRAASERRDFGPLQAMFDRIVSEAAPAARRDARWRDAERERLSFPATTNPADNEHLRR